MRGRGHEHSWFSFWCCIFLVVSLEVGFVFFAERRAPVLQDGKVFVSDQQDLME